MPQTDIQNGDLGSVVREIINSQFQELYARKNNFLVMFSTLVLNLTNQPNTEQQLGAANSLNIRPTLDTNRFTQIRIGCRLNVVSASVNSPRLYPAFSAGLTLNPTFTVIGAGTVASGDAVSLASPQGQKISNWINLPVEAIGDNITFQIFQNGGDGVEDPQLTSVWIEFR